MEIMMLKNKYPIYIVSKGRAKTGQTRKALAALGMHFYIAIEPQDYDAYAEEVPEDQLLVLPFSNHGDGPGRARNWVWDHAIANGAEKHWVMDDNIDGFYRLHNNQRVKVETGSLFRICEDFIDRYENVPVSGLNYYCFAVPGDTRPAFVKNTRIYSCLLIDNKCKYRWRGRYNEDTDLSLRVMKDGDCTIQFNLLLQNKMATQTMKGGNTEEFYHKEGEVDKKKWRDGQMNATGTMNKSQMLVDMHPDVCRMAWKYGRWHHYCDYKIFENTPLILKPEFQNIPKGNNEYGLKLIKLKDKDAIKKY